MKILDSIGLLSGEVTLAQENLVHSTELAKSLSQEIICGMQQTNSLRSSKEAVGNITSSFLNDDFLFSVVCSIVIV